MLSHWPYSLLLFPALHLAWEDFRMREVSVLWLAVLGALSVAVGWGVSGLYPMLWRAVVNAGVLAALGFAMLLYQLCRRRPLRDFFSRDFGAGDAVMMAAVARCSHLASTCVSCSRPASQHWCGGASGARRPFPWPDLWR